jgi:hypothetical protein
MTEQIKIDKDCFYLAVMGGKEKCSWRGMTLQTEADWFDSVLIRSLNLEMVIDCQMDIIQRARKIYNKTAIAQEEALLQKLESFRNLSVKQQRHALLDLMMEKEE